MSVINAPYETSITSFFNSLGELSGFLEDISPAFILLVTNNIALHKSEKEQRIMDRRIRKCKRICKINKLTSNLVIQQVNLDFQDLNSQQQSEISNLMNFELLTK